MLSGEPPEAVDGAARGEAERLARTLGALSASPPPTSEELPGEAAALAAFRKARAERADAGATPADPGAQASGEVSDAGVVRIGTARGRVSGAVRRPRWARPARLAVAAALAVGMVGGVAVAAGTGVLRAPFGGEEPEPGASVSAAVTPHERPLMSPSPSDGGQGGSTPGDGAPDDTQDGTSTGGTGGSGRGEARDDASPKPDAGDRGDRPGDSRREIASACRDLRDGKRLDAGRKRALRDAAGGTRVWGYCEGVLSTAGPRSTERNDKRSDTDGQKNKNKNKEKNTDGDGQPEPRQDRKQDQAERTAGERAEKQAGDEDDGDRGRSPRSLAPLRPAVSSPVEISWPRV
ncbi:hypothetical protein GCM10010383_18940 [Streptomyces lomondensis]|uniref:Uncharacterized protein n=1 Tax=Streptomyces lomondensis TaxID=68229 RepID=A0ABQ2X0N1_9ACTN|nr:hypothetical protein GCM10010383_18940 [Streptomyces lomondensis]